MKNHAQQLRILCGFLLIAGSLQANTINVQCGGSQNPNSITAALQLLNPVVPNTLNISGTCTENVVINKFNRLTLSGRSGSRVVDASGKTSQTILVIDSTDVVFQNMNIDGGIAGIQCDSFSVCRFSGVTVRNSGAGIQITQSRAELDTTTIRHTQNGLTSLDGSSVRLDFGVDIEDGQVGIDVQDGSSLDAISATVSNNQMQGFYVSDGAHLSLSSTTVSGNSSGVAVQSHSSVDFGAGNTVTANQDFGVYLFDLSYATFNPGNNITGNDTSGHGALDVQCFAQFSATRGALTNIGGGTTNCAEPGGSHAPAQGAH
jgi:hypothetical protein